MMRSTEWGRSEAKLRDDESRRTRIIATFMLSDSMRPQNHHSFGASCRFVYALQEPQLCRRLNVYLRRGAIGHDRPYSPILAITNGLHRGESGRGAFPRRNRCPADAPFRRISS